MELVGKPETREWFSPEFKRELVEKIVLADRTLGDLADEMGIPPEVMRKWALLIERAEALASSADERRVPVSRVIELKHRIEELRRQIERQAMTIQILAKRGLV